MTARRRLVPLLALAVCGALSPAAPAATAAEALPRATADRPDDRPGPQVRLLYLLPADAPDRALDTGGTIAASLDAGNRWLRERTGRSLDLDTAGGALDVTFVRLPRTAAAYESVRTRAAVQDDLRAMGQDDGEDTLLGFYAGRDGGSRCGESFIGPRTEDAFLALVFDVQPDGFSSCTTGPFAGPGEDAGTQDLSVVHELFHAAGAVSLCAPHADAGYHVTDDDTDLMAAAGDPQVVDVGGDDYFGLDPSSPCVDVARSELLLPDAFTHLTRSVHAPGIRDLAGRGVVGGFDDGTYRPGEQVSRGQLATFLARAGEYEPDGTNDPSDVPAGSTHGQAVRAVLDNGIATGYADGTYRPAPAVTRGQTATLLKRALDLPVPDACAIPDARGVHRDGICAVVDAGIASGFDDGTYRPDQAVTRGQMATLVARAFPG